ncbi:unnamed protein product [Closterium sp. Yama58-4]|nr:unnamed protein product [Closterium sp. Yama58-4]
MLLTSPAIGPLDADVANMEVPLCSKYFGACAAATDARPTATDVGLAATDVGTSESAADVTAAGVPSAGVSAKVPRQPLAVASGSVQFSPLGALAFSPQQLTSAMCYHMRLYGISLQHPEQPLFAACQLKPELRNALLLQQTPPELDTFDIVNRAVQSGREEQMPEPAIVRVETAVADEAVADRAVADEAVTETAVAGAAAADIAVVGKAGAETVGAETVGADNALANEPAEDEAHVLFASLLPSLLSRLDCLLTARDIRRFIVRQYGCERQGCCEATCEENCKSSGTGGERVLGRRYGGGECREGEQQQEPHFPAIDLLRALTCPGTTESGVGTYESDEVLGDSCVQLAASCHLFATGMPRQRETDGRGQSGGNASMPSHAPHSHPSLPTYDDMKGQCVKLVSNKHLAALALKAGVPALVRCKPFRTSDWVGPLVPPSHAVLLLADSLSYALPQPQSSSHASSHAPSHSLLTHTQSQAAAPLSSPSQATGTSENLPPSPKALLDSAFASLAAVQATAAAKSARQLGKKTLADVAEALVGASWRCGGADMALPMLRWLGMPTEGVGELLRGEMTWKRREGVVDGGVVEVRNDWIPGVAAKPDMAVEAKPVAAAAAAAAADEAPAGVAAIVAAGESEQRVTGSKHALEPPGEPSLLPLQPPEKRLKQSLSHHHPTTHRQANRYASLAS